MAAKVSRPCQRNDCPAPARAGVELNHADMAATLVDLPGERDPRRMELCADHAARMTVPRGWTRVDDREDQDGPPAQGPPSVTEIASRSTLEVLTAALESDPDEPAAAIGPVEAGIDLEDEPEGGIADGPSTAAVMAAVIAHGPRPEGDDPVDEVMEVVTDSGTQLVLAAADRMARRARPVPAARDD